MNCRPLYVGKVTIGDRYDDGKVFVFFPNTHFNEQEFDRLFSQWRLKHLKQTHSSTIVSVTDNQDFTATEGDALLTTLTDTALSVYTADCVPLLVHDPVGGRVAAIHAGWRGLVGGIIGATLKSMKPADPSQVRVWIGPHIRKDSFEVHADVAEQLQACTETRVTFEHPTENEKRLVDLTTIALAQIQSFGIQSANTWIHPADTFRDESFYSYRRGASGRLINFIVLQ